MVVRIFLTVKVEPGYITEVFSKLKKKKEVSLICLIDRGVFDIIAIIDVKSFEEYHTLMAKKISSLRHLEDYTSFIALDV